MSKDDDFVPKEVCDERHNSLKSVREEVIKKNDSEHEAMDERFITINVSIQDLSKSTTVNLERVHSRIDVLNTTINDKFTEVNDKVTVKIEEMNNSVNSKFTELTRCIYAIQDNLKNKVIWMLVGIISSLVLALASIVWQAIKPMPAKQDFTKLEYTLELMDNKLERNSKISNEVNHRMDEMSKKFYEYQKRDKK